MTQKISYQIGNSLYLSITDRCTLVCAFCPKTLGNTVVQGYDLSMDHRPSVEEIMASIDDPTKYDEVVFCGYGEPTLRLNVLLEVAQQIKAAGGKVRINTDGLANLVHKRNTLPEMAGCIDALSISMNAQDQTTYDCHTQPTLPGSYNAMLAFLAEAPKHIAQVTATALDGLEGVDIAACEKLAQRCGVLFRKRTLGRVG
ncbi:MAG: TatD family nuclease-associated radical SAM protein [Candidatus Polarisedimenticolaceae bacterium]|nr:TatD family nuclease-associated radical SAM protein [Candidatus Polarisedimenticolaceae bacterium]